MIGSLLPSLCCEGVFIPVVPPIMRFQCGLEQCGFGQMSAVETGASYVQHQSGSRRTDQLVGTQGGRRVARPPL